MAISLLRQDLRGQNQCVPPLHTCGKPPTPSNPAQLLAQIIAGHLNVDNDKKTVKIDVFSPNKLGLKPTYGDFLGMYDLDF